MDNMESTIHHFVEICVEEFKNFLKCDIIAKRPFFVASHPVDDDEESFAISNKWALLGIIHYSGDVEGSCSISVHKDFALHMADTLFSKKHTEIDDDVIAGVKEIVNIIAGKIKYGLEGLYPQIIISLPIIAKQGDKIDWNTDKPRIMCVPFTVPDHEHLDAEPDKNPSPPFCMLVSIERKEKDDVFAAAPAAKEKSKSA